MTHERSEEEEEKKKKRGTSTFSKLCLSREWGRDGGTRRKPSLYKASQVISNVMWNPQITP